MKASEFCVIRLKKERTVQNFELLPLLWLMWEDKDAGLLDPEIVEMVKHASLGFRYWVDEPGTSSMFYCSENHRIGFHVCEYLAGLLYPEDIFTNCWTKWYVSFVKGTYALGRMAESALPCWL